MRRKRGEGSIEWARSGVGGGLSYCCEEAVSLFPRRLSIEQPGGHAWPRKAPPAGDVEWTGAR
jgi:hypothetical protein